VISSILPPEVVKNLNELAPFLLEHGLSLITAIIILVAGNWVSAKAQHWTVAALRRTPHIDATLQSFFGSLARYFVLGFTLLAVLAEFGVQTASLIAVLGAAGLAVGLALQGTLSNVAAGVMLLIFRPFRAGHYVEVGGLGGTVKELTLFTTELAAPDNVQIIIPNSEVWGSAIRNYSFHPTRRLDLIFGISYSDDIGEAMKAMREIIDADKRVLADPEPLIAVNALGASSVDMLLRVWLGNADYWPAKFDLTRAVKERFDATGITIPFPTQTVQHVTAPAPQSGEKPGPVSASR
jgi:small conductance mechanosensitive channel